MAELTSDYEHDAHGIDTFGSLDVFKRNDIVSQTAKALLVELTPCPFRVGERVELLTGQRVRATGIVTKIKRSQQHRKQPDGTWPLVPVWQVRVRAGKTRFTWLSENIRRAQSN